MLSYYSLIYFIRVAEKVCIALTLSGEFRRSFEGVLKGVLTFRVYVSKGLL